MRRNHQHYQILKDEIVSDYVVSKQVYMYRVSFPIIFYKICLQLLLQEMKASSNVTGKRVVPFALKEIWKAHDIK